MPLLASRPARASRRRAARPAQRPSVYVQGESRASRRSADARGSPASSAAPIRALSVAMTRGGAAAAHRCRRLGWRDHHGEPGSAPQTSSRSGGPAAQVRGDPRERPRAQARSARPRGIQPCPRFQDRTAWFSRASAAAAGSPATPARRHRDAPRRSPRTRRTPSVSARRAAGRGPARSGSSPRPRPVRVWAHPLDCQTIARTTDRRCRVAVMVAGSGDCGSLLCADAGRTWCFWRGGRCRDEFPDHRKPPTSAFPLPESLSDPPTPPMPWRARSGGARGARHALRASSALVGSTRAGLVGDLLRPRAGGLASAQQVVRDVSPARVRRGGGHGPPSSGMRAPSSGATVAAGWHPRPAGSCGLPHPAFRVYTNPDVVASSSGRGEERHRAAAGMADCMGYATHHALVPAGGGDDGLAGGPGRQPADLPGWRAWVTGPPPHPPVAQPHGVSARHCLSCAVIAE